MVRPHDRQQFAQDGFCLLEGFSSRSTCDAMLSDVIGVARAAQGGSAGILGFGLYWVVIRNWG